MTSSNRQAAQKRGPSQGFCNCEGYVLLGESGDELATPITVAIPTYNGAEYVKSALQSVLDQQGVGLRVLVCDDGSDDDTVDVVRSVDDPRVEVQCAERRHGLTANWNRCLDSIQTPFLCLFHQDDIMKPDNLARKVRLLEQHPRAGFVYSAIDVIDEQGDPVAETRVNRDRIPGSDRAMEPAEFLPILLAKNVVRASSVVIRRRCLDEVGPFDSSYHHVVDWEMWLRLAERHPVAWIASPLVTVRWHHGSESHRQRERDTDLAEYDRLLRETIVDLCRKLQLDAKVLRRAKRNLAEGYVNRVYHCLRNYKQPLRARENLLRALRTSPGIVRTLLGDPKFLAMAAGLLVAPRTAFWLLESVRPSSPPDA